METRYWRLAGDPADEKAQTEAAAHTALLRQAAKPHAIAHKIKMLRTLKKKRFFITASGALLVVLIIARLHGGFQRGTIVRRMKWPAAV